jgi:metal-responsive CopG/Arc/MetJ family transcriptional regulator
MGDTARFGISIDSDLIRVAIVEEKMDAGQEEMAGAVTMVYNHHDHCVSL